MIRNTDHLLLVPIFANTFWMLALVTTGFFTLWFLLVVQETRSERRPRFNLKEI